MHIAVDRETVLRLARPLAVSLGPGLTDRRSLGQVLYFLSCRSRSAGLGIAVRRRPWLPTRKEILTFMRLGLVLRTDIQSMNVRTDPGQDYLQTARASHMVWR